jgi:nucleotide-binding universal stress UspA family protein
MYTRLLVPLDDSELSREVLPHARQLARRLDVPVMLLSVVTTRAAAYRDTGEALVPEADASEAVRRVEDETADAERHLDAARRELENGGVRAETAVIAGDPAETIARVAREQEGCVICMSTRGRGGVSRFVLGSVADAVVRHADSPVFLVNGERAVGI